MFPKAARLPFSAGTSVNNNTKLKSEVSILLPFKYSKSIQAYRAKVFRYPLSTKIISIFPKQLVIFTENITLDKVYLLLICTPFQYPPRAHTSQLTVLDQEREDVQCQGQAGDLPREREGGQGVHQQALHLPRVPGRLCQLLLCLGHLQT